MKLMIMQRLGLLLSVILLIGGTISCSSSRTETMRVASERVDCFGFDEQLCYKVKHQGDDHWSMFYNSIDGFNFESGYEYNLKVKIVTIDNPMADGSSEKYYLKKVLSKVKVESDDLE
ncbi:MAG: DUF4377 domain-containing protein [Bacteroidales bacterium]